MAVDLDQIYDPEIENDYFADLGFGENLSPAEQRQITREHIRKAYFKLSREDHPDKGGSGDRMKQVRKAYELLENDKFRKEYVAHSDRSWEKIILTYRLLGLASLVMQDEAQTQVDAAGEDEKQLAEKQLAEKKLDELVNSKVQQLIEHRYHKLKGWGGAISKALAFPATLVYVIGYQFIIYPLLNAFRPLIHNYSLKKKLQKYNKEMGDIVYDWIEDATNLDCTDTINDIFEQPSETEYDFPVTRADLLYKSVVGKTIQEFLIAVAEEYQTAQVVTEAHLESLAKVQFNSAENMEARNKVYREIIGSIAQVQGDSLLDENKAVRNSKAKAIIEQLVVQQAEEQYKTNKLSVVSMVVATALNALFYYYLPKLTYSLAVIGGLGPQYRRPIVSSYQHFAYQMSWTLDWLAYDVLKLKQLDLSKFALESQVENSSTADMLRGTGRGNTLTPQATSSLSPAQAYQADTSNKQQRRSIFTTVPSPHPAQDTVLEDKSQKQRRYAPTNANDLD